MIKLASVEQCSGCMSCVQSCVKQCIVIHKTEQGHLYPVIDTERCISCKKCQQACPILHVNSFQYPQKAYAVWSLDEEGRKASSSGGVAAEFYHAALTKDFWICGAEYTERFHVVHTLTKEQHKIEKFRQSKYVYSEMGNIFKEVKRKLDNKESVLFISLPCKVAGLRNYLGKEYKNLVTVDIVCHGTPAYQPLYQHIRHCQGKGVAKRLRFRQDNEFFFWLTDGKKTLYKKTGRQDTYLAAFLEGLDYRPSCYRCPYAKPERISDLTISDFWGIGVEVPFNHPYTGAISAVLVNTEKGKNFFINSRNGLFVEERPVIEVINGNAQLNHPTSVHPKREQFERLYTEEGFEKAVKKCLNKEIREDKRKLNKNIARQKIKKIVGVFIKKYRG